MTEKQREYMKDLVSKGRNFRRLATIEKQGDSEFKFILTTEDVDRHGEKVKIAGVDLKNFKKNPIMLYQHQSSQRIGVWKDIKKEDGKITAIAKFDSNDETGLAQRIERLITDKMLKAVSIGFISKRVDFEEVPENDVREFQERFWRDFIVVHSRTDLLEVSVVELPANPHALLTKSFDSNEYKNVTQEDYDWLLAQTKELEGKDQMSLEDEDQMSLEDAIKLNQYLIYDIEIKGQHLAMTGWEIIKAIEKAGATISKANLIKLQIASDKIQSVIDSAIKETDEDEDKDNNNERIFKIISEIMAKQYETDTQILESTISETIGEQSSEIDLNTYLAKYKK